MPDSLPPAKHDPHPQRFDRAVFDRTLNSLPPASAAEHLRSLSDLMQEMIRLLERHASPAEREDMGHALCSAAGMFGFGALSDASRNFERAVSIGSLDTEDFANQLVAETGAAFRILVDLLAAGCERASESSRLAQVT